MLNVIWPIFIITSVIIGTINGKIGVLNETIFETLESTNYTIISMIGTICFWNGIIYVLKETKLFSSMVDKFGFIIEKMFYGISRNSEIGKNIAINMISNILGIGNAATVSGLKAVDKLDENNTKQYMSKNMMIFILINTASIQLIPTTIISIRASIGSRNPGKIIICVWIVSIIVFAFEFIVGKIFFTEGNLSD